MIFECFLIKQINVIMTDIKNNEQIKDNDFRHFVAT
jgi:hypothetical protein